jgi:hypothetical protein
MMKALLLCVSLIGTAYACSYVEVPVLGKPGGAVIGRTMELGAALGTWEVTKYPRQLTGGMGYVGVDLVS